MELLVFLIFSAMVTAAIVRIHSLNTKARIETNPSVLEHKLWIRELDDAKETRMLGDGK